MTDSAAPASAAPEGGPRLTVVRGGPTAEELAAVTAVLTARASLQTVPPEAPRRGRWADPALRLRRYTRPGVGGWSASARW